ncbi:MAG: hypothetical protein AAF511_04500, partial [Pseudomonadota bacterium]
RAEARAYAQTQGLPFIDDPSNEDENFERVRVRALLAALEQQDLLTVEALCRSAQRWRRVIEPAVPFNEAADGAVVYANADHLLDGGLDPDGAINAIITALGLLPSRPKQSAEPGSMSAQAPHAFPADIFSDRSRISADALSGMTLNGVVIRVFGDRGLVFFREPAALLGRADGTPGLAPVAAPARSRHLFDRRFIVAVPSDAPDGLELCALGQLLPKDIAMSTLARQRIATLPALAKGNQLTHLPEEAVDAIQSALSGWKMGASFLSTAIGTFPARSLLAERFAGDVIRF